MNKEMTVNGKSYTIIKLLGKGKGGYSYLAESGNNRYVLKQIHHEPCDYYQFGNKLEAEIRDYRKLKEIGIKMPVMLETDVKNERILKEFIDGDTIYQLVLEDKMKTDYIDNCIECVRCYMLPIRILIIFQRILLYITKKYIMWISSAMITWKNGILKTGV